MNKKSDDNLDKNSQKQTPFFLYDEDEKSLWRIYFFARFMGDVTGFPMITLNRSRNNQSLRQALNLSQSLKLVKFFDFNFFGLGEKKYNEITENLASKFMIYLFVFCFLGGIPCSFGLIFLLSFLRQIYRTELLVFPIIIATQFMYMSMYMRLLFRIVEYLMPEILCIMQIINLNLELTRNDVIYRRELQSMILFRMDYLARVTMLIPWRYSMGRSSNQKWIQKHFQNISYYIRERRRWLIAPNETTLDDLRRDFRKLAYYYLTGKYGAWEWQSFELPTEVIKQTRFQKVQGTLIRFFGIALPLLIMAFYIVFPDKFPNPNAEVLKNLPYIFIAWLLVSLDITLKLGVIESLTKLITGLKDLSK